MFTGPFYSRSKPPGMQPYQTSPYVRKQSDRSLSDLEPYIGGESHPQPRDNNTLNVDPEHASQSVKRKGDGILPPPRKVVKTSLLGSRQLDLRGLHGSTPSNNWTSHRGSAEVNTDGSRLTCFKTLTEDRSVNEKQILLCAIATKEIVVRHSTPSLSLLQHNDENLHRRFGEHHQQAGGTKTARIDIQKLLSVPGQYSRLQLAQQHQSTYQSASSIPAPAQTPVNPQLAALLAQSSGQRQSALSMNGSHVVTESKEYTVAHDYLLNKDERSRSRKLTAWKKKVASVEEEEDKQEDNEVDVPVKSILSTSDSITALATNGPSRPVVSSYWSIPEIQKFRQLIGYYGRDYACIADFMKTKTQKMIANQYAREIGKGDFELERLAAEAEDKRVRGVSIGPPPSPLAPITRKYDLRPSIKDSWVTRRPRQRKYV